MSRQKTDRLETFVIHEPSFVRLILELRIFNNGVQNLRNYIKWMKFTHTRGENSRLRVLQTVLFSNDTVFSLFFFQITIFHKAQTGEVNNIFACSDTLFKLPRFITSIIIPVSNQINEFIQKIFYPSHTEKLEKGPQSRLPNWSILNTIQRYYHKRINKIMLNLKKVSLFLYLNGKPKV